MALDSPAVLARLREIVAGLPGVAQVQLGVPASIGPRVAAYITCAGQRIERVTTGPTFRRRARYRVTFAYRVEGAEEGAEQELARLVDAFIAAVLADLTLGSTLRDVTLDLGAADAPRYVNRPEEYREYPIAVEGLQQHP